MNNNDYKIVELNAELGRLKLNRNLKVLSSGALSFVGISNYIIISNACFEECALESGLFLVGAVGFGISAIKKNRQVKLLQKQINKLHYK